MINAIQQLGLGVINKEITLEWFARVLGFRTVIFNDQGDATFMTQYTGGEICQRDAALVLNSHGGGGLEIWQHISRQPIAQPKNMNLHSTGFLICKVRCKGIDAVIEQLWADREPSLSIIGNIEERPTGERCCYFSVFGSWFQLVEEKCGYFRDTGTSFCAGVMGVTVGVDDMERSLKFYRNVLGYNHIVQDKEGEWSDWTGFYDLNQSNSGVYRRVLLRRENPETGLYAKVFGVGEIELIKTIHSSFGELWQTTKEGLRLSKGTHLYSDRYWGDPGFIHLCFDVSQMAELAESCARLGAHFTVDTGADFSMGKLASGRFAYLEDPDGSLIEFVETYRIPILKKPGLFLNVKGRAKALPRWILKFAVKDNYREKL
ncbi:VOC family protein [Candidatus Haliotispira prima]|uniref:VOC family protein n=1 Tax=Candidatus Haliotispira prima TaxID=3034016 RepID=A0ABY8MG61_9SPIO|nr:VOC family protein [Candidatus Haliotispira prima]